MHACLGNSFRFQGRLHHGMHEAIVQRRIVVVFKHPTPHPLTNGRLFSLGSRVCTSILTLQFWHHTNYHSILVTYPPHAVTLPSLTNLGPVARLDLLLFSRLCPQRKLLNSFTILILPSRPSDHVTRLMTPTARLTGRLKNSIASWDAANFVTTNVF